MDSPLAPVLPNWLNKYNPKKPKFYLRQVDDILAAFEKEQDSLDF